MSKAKELPIKEEDKYHKIKTIQSDILKTTGSDIDKIAKKMVQLAENESKIDRNETNFKANAVNSVLDYIQNAIKVSEEKINSIDETNLKLT